MNQQNSQETFLTVAEVAARLRVDETTVRRWIKRGVLSAVALPHLGKRQAYRIRQSTLDALIHQAH
jgi:excisionase family DNA binding protein